MGKMPPLLAQVFIPKVQYIITGVISSSLERWYFNLAFPCPQCPEDSLYSVFRDVMKIAMNWLL